MGRFRGLVTATAAVALIGSVVAACGGASTPAPTKMTDVKAIAAKAATVAQTAKAIHAKLTVTGKVKFDASALTGGTSTGTPTEMDLAGTNAELWLDVATQDMHMTLNAQPFMNTTADLIQTGGYSYVKVGGPFASMMGDSAGKYIKSKATPSTPDVTDTAKAVDDINTALAKPGVDAKLVGTEKVNGRDAYHITANVPQDQLNMGSEVPVTVSSASMDLYVAVDNQQLIRAVVKASGTDMGSVTVTADIDYPSSVSITAPPADQVVEQSPSV